MAHGTLEGDESTQFTAEVNLRTPTVQNGAHYYDGLAGQVLTREASKIPKEKCECVLMSQRITLWANKGEA